MKAKAQTLKNSHIIIITSVVAIALIYGLFSINNTSAFSRNKTSELNSNGSNQNEHVLYDRNKYQDYTKANFNNASSNGNILLFFAATKWCNTCTKLDEEIKLRSVEIPDNLTILKVDYDNDKKTVNDFSVTIQTTLVLLDSTGKELDRWVNGDFETILSKNTVGKTSMILR